MTIALLALLILAAPADPPGDGLEPLTVAVVDDETGGPVTSLRYRMYYESPGRNEPYRDEWTAVASPSGTFVVRVPKSCKLHLTVKGRDYLGGRGMYHKFLIRSTDDPRRVVVKLTPGITVRGTVRDAATKAPIAGAKVEPNSPTGLHRVSLDELWAVETDKEGHYELRGVDPEGGVSASHPDYGWEKREREKAVGPRHDIFLPLGELLRGTVRDASGRPLEGVLVEDYAHRRTETGRDGTFALRNGAWDLTLSKEGYITRRLSGKDEVRKEGLVVVMEPPFAIEGQVIAPDGRPAGAFLVKAGPSRLPKSYECTLGEVPGQAGHFILKLDKPGLHWVGVRAEGYAPCERTVEVARGMKPLAVRLEPGVTASGRVVAPARGEGEIRASLVPRRDKSDHGGLNADLAEEFASQKATVAPDGTLRFEHLRPDRYLLRLDGPGLIPTALALDVPAEGLDLGTIRLASPGRGRVVGRVFRPEGEGGGPWPFASGYVLSPAFGWGREILFRADESGRFAVEGVPTRLVQVGFQYQVFDVIRSHVWTSQVVEGQTTEVHAFDPGRMHPLAIQFDVGDGSDAQFEAGTGRAAKRLVENVTKEMNFSFGEKEPKKVELRDPTFHLELKPRSRAPLAFSEPEWERTDPRKQVILADVPPGAYRLRVRDFLGNINLTEALLFDEEVVVSPSKPIHIPLGAGCITGKCPKNDGYHLPVVVVALPLDRRGPSRRTRCDGDGNFCVRYLAPGRYTLRALDPAIGWTQLDDVVVGVGATDVGDLRLKPGGTLAGTIAFRRPGPIPDEVVATDETGVALTSRFESYSSFDRFELRGLWPGRWTVAARSGGAPVASDTVTLTGTESARVGLATAAGDGP